MPRFTAMLFTGQLFLYWRWSSQHCFLHYVFILNQFSRQIGSKFPRLFFVFVLKPYHVIFRLKWRTTRLSKKYQVGQKGIKKKFQKAIHPEKKSFIWRFYYISINHFCFGSSKIMRSQAVKFFECQICLILVKHMKMSCTCTLRYNFFMSCVIIFKYIMKFMIQACKTCTKCGALIQKRIKIWFSYKLF